MILDKNIISQALQSSRQAGDRILANENNSFTIHTRGE